MSVHPSLRATDKGKQYRSVWKRFERIRKLKEEEKWDEENSVFGLPKLKIFRAKMKKRKAVVEKETAVEGTAAEAAAEAAAGTAVPATGEVPAKKEKSTLSSKGGQGGSASGGKEKKK